MLHHKGLFVRLLCVVMCTTLLFGVETASAKEASAKTTKEEAYIVAQELLEAGDLYGAVDAFTALKSFEDSKTYLAYTNARLLVCQADYEKAYTAFAKLGDFLDSQANAEVLADMRLMPFCDSGTLAMLAEKGEELREDSIEKFASSALNTYLPSETFAYGLMDGEGNQKTRLEWPWVGGLACSLGMRSDPAADGSSMNTEHDYGLAASPHHVTAYLVYDGELEKQEYGYPKPPARYASGYGLIDAKGDLLVEAKYGDLLWSAFGMAAFCAPFAEGTAAYLFCLDAEQAPYEPLGEWDEILQPMDNDSLFAVRKGDAWQYVGRDGLPVGESYDGMRTHQAGYGAVQMNGKWGLVDGEGSLTVPCQYEEILDVYNGLTAVREGDAWHFIRPDGERAFDGDYLQADEFWAGRAPVQTVDGLWGYIDETGSLVIAAEYTEAKPFDPTHRAPVAIDGKWGYVDRDGKQVVKPQYDGLFNFMPNGLAIVEVKGKYGLVNRAGKVVVKPQWTGIGLDAAWQIRVNTAKGQISRVNASGKTYLTFTPKYKQRHQYMTAMYPSGTSAMYLRFESYPEAFWAEYYNAQGKRLKVKLDVEMEETKGSAKAEAAVWSQFEMVPRAVSADAPHRNINLDVISGGMNGLEDVSLYPFLPDQTVGDMQAGRLEAEWSERLIVVDELIQSWYWDADNKKLHVSDSTFSGSRPSYLPLISVVDAQTGLGVSYSNPRYDFYGSGELTGFARRSIKLPTEWQEFEQSRYQGRTTFNTPTGYIESDQENIAWAVYYSELMEKAEQQKNADELLVILTPITEPYVKPYLAFMAEEQEAGRRYSGDGDLVITQGERWQDIVLFPFSDSYTMEDFEGKVSDPAGWTERLTMTGNYVDRWEGPKYIDETTAVTLSFFGGDNRSYDEGVNSGYSGISVELPNQSVYRIAGYSPLDDHEELSDNGCYYWRLDKNMRTVDYLPERTFYATLLEDLLALGVHAEPLCDAVQTRLANAEEKLIASGKPEPKPVHDELSAADSTQWVSVTDAWLVNGNANATWEDICALPVTSHTLGEILQATASDKRAPWYRRLSVDFEWDITMEQGQPIDVSLPCAEGAVSFSDPIYNAQGVVTGFANVVIFCWASGIDFSIDGTKGGEPIYRIGEDQLSQEDFYALLWNCLLFSGDEAKPMLESLNRVLTQMEDQY